MDNIGNGREIPRMDATGFKEEIRKLTGRPVANLSPEENTAIDDLLGDALANAEQHIDYSQFNELLLIVNKDRVTKFFFEYFFGTTCAIKDLWRGVESFQKTALRCFGNFIYAYRMLSKVENPQGLEQHLGDYCKDATSLWSRFKNRGHKIVDIKQITKENTSLLGYLSSAPMREEHRIVDGLHRLLQNSDTWEDLLAALDTMRERVQDQQKEVAVVKKTFDLIKKLRANSPEDALPADLQERIQQDKLKIDTRYTTLEGTEALGNRNTDIYLSWDHMDIYFATSMRNRWEYEDCFQFIDKLMDQPIRELPKKLEPLRDELQGKTLRELKVRYFDPTQSYDKNRINKGLVEALMLKRAACTVYSVQDTDTLGKDSELAATLAQGKPVLAYAPTIVIQDKTDELLKERPADLKYRLQFVLYADERELTPEDTNILLSFLPKLEEFETKRLWKSITYEAAEEDFRREHRDDLRTFCETIARSQARIYDKREGTLRDSHPLGIQVNLESGVANGVLIAREISQCADVLLRILTNTMEFDLDYKKELGCWVLQESLTKSIYRVVTDDQKLTNCFWNFYPQRTQDRRRNN